ncbi:winged helix-turn-helix transcriptional regulator [Candidatus Woesearchaeota archaeon]|nr:winged helix-turn-helix transcriptional regulator [Candidatus Woesearchaeota archaeon]
MLTEKQKQIIRLLLTNKEGYNVNQIARILSISVSWTHETLKFLEREGILASAKIANSIFFKVNWNNPKAEKICDFIILDEQSKESLIKKDEKHTNKFENSVKITDKNNYGIANNPVSESNVYSVGSNLLSPTIESPYRQAIINSNPNTFSYSVAPVGEQGVTSVLSAYANSGAFGTSAYSSNYNTSSNTPVPAGTLGSRISRNVSGFTLAMHTASHKDVTNSGCRYCGPEIKAPF